MMILPEGVVLRSAEAMAAMKGKVRSHYYSQFAPRPRCISSIKNNARDTLQGTTPPPRMSGRMFNRPTDIAVHPRTGELFISDGYGNNHVHRLTADGAHITTWGGSGAASPGRVFH